jgi:hypothetical protein
MLDVTGRLALRVVLPAELLEQLGIESRRRGVSIGLLVDALCEEHLPDLVAEAVRDRIRELVAGSHRASLRSSQ